jgi:uncharacterized protein YcbX
MVVGIEVSDKDGVVGAWVPCGIEDQGVRGKSYIPCMHVRSLHLYPIKGCRGYAVDALAIDRFGPVGDRRLMLVDARGRFISQREHPGLATITPTLEGNRLSATAPVVKPLDHELTANGAIRAVTLWGDDGLQVVDQGDAAAEWFSSVIGQSCRLVRYGAMTHRPIDPTYSPRPEAETTFTDGYPVLAVTDASLEALNSQLSTPVPMGRFRPTVVVSGAPAWGEDTWRAVAVGEVILDAVKPCVRCVVTTTDQETGNRDTRQEPLRTLARIHTLPHFGVSFGQNLVPRSTGVVRVGDSVRPV